MDYNLATLRKRMIETLTEFIRAQRAYLEAAAIGSGKSETELKGIAEEYLASAEPYDAVLQELHQYLIAEEPSEVIAEELDHTERLINALNKHKRVVAKLIVRHTESINHDVKLTSRHAEEEEE